MKIRRRREKKRKRGRKYRRRKKRLDKCYQKITYGRRRRGNEREYTSNRAFPQKDAFPRDEGGREVKKAGGGTLR